MNDNLNPCNNEELVSKVFNNSLIVEKILNYTTDFLMKNLELRLVNKEFNESCLRILRGDHSTVRIHYEIDCCVRESPNMIYINRRRMLISNSIKYLKFLAKTTKLKIKELFTQNLWELTEPLQRIIHDSIIPLIDDESIKVFTGMEDICNSGCSFCLNIALKCRSYGPMQINFFDEKIETERTFDELIVTDYLLDELANKCVKSSETKEECLHKLNQLIQPNISCNKLTLWITEMRHFADDEDPDGPSGFHYPFPREVFEMMLENWNVQMVTFRIIYIVRCHIYYNDWSSKGWFTEFQLNVPSNLNEQSRLNSDIVHVTIELDESRYCRFVLLVYDPIKCVEVLGFINIISNVQKILSCNQITVNFPIEYPAHIVTFEDALNNFLIAVNKANTEHMRINVQLFSGHSPSCGVREFKEVPSQFWVGDKLFRFEVQSRRLSCGFWSFIKNTLQDFSKMQYGHQYYIGRRINIRNEKTDCNITMDVFFKQYDISNLRKQSFEDSPKNAFIKYFVDSIPF